MYAQTPTHNVYAREQPCSSVSPHWQSTPLHRTTDGTHWTNDGGTNACVVGLMAETHVATPMPSCTRATYACCDVVDVSYEKPIDVVPSATPTLTRDVARNPPPTTPPSACCSDAGSVRATSVQLLGTPRGETSMAYLQHNKVPGQQLPEPDHVGGVGIGVQRGRERHRRALQAQSPAGHTPDTARCVAAAQCADGLRYAGVCTPHHLPLVRQCVHPPRTVSQPCGAVLCRAGCRRSTRPAWPSDRALCFARTTQCPLPWRTHTHATSAPTGSHRRQGW